MSDPTVRAAQLVAALGGRWRDFQQTGIAKCPAHEDKRPSLAVTDRDGKVLLKCWAGCTQDVVLDALRARGLWHCGSRTLTSTVRVQPRDNREVRWLVDDIQLLNAEPDAAMVWEFLRHAAELSPFALEIVSRVLRKARPSCRPLVRQWFDHFMEPTNAPDMEQVA